MPEIPGLRYSWNRDETVMHLTYDRAGGAPRTFALRIDGDGGLLMTATEERLDPTNPEHLERARILAEIMIARTGLSS